MRDLSSAQRYVIETGRSQVVVIARSNVHDIRTVFSHVSGTLSADPADLTGGGASVELAVDMTRFDAGDFLRNRKLKRDLDLERHPEAQFSLGGLEDVVTLGGDRFSARARGALRWRGTTLEIAATGDGHLDQSALEARATFELNVRHLGITPPRILMFKVEDTVTVEVTLVARAA